MSDCEAGERVADIRVTRRSVERRERRAEWVARTIDEYPILAVAAAVADGVDRSFPT